MANRKSDYKTMSRKLHLGSGRCYLPPSDGWTNVDFFTHAKADAYHDVTNLSFEKGSFSLIYCSHLLEHVHRHAVVATLSHWRDLLVPGGVLRLAVPNFSAVCEVYRMTGDLPSLMGLLYGGQDNYLNRHTVTFDEATLCDALFKAGFSSVRPWNWRNTEHSEYDDFSQAYLPHLQKENGTLMSLNLEAVK